MHNFLRQGALRAASPLQPPPPASGTPMNASRKRSACSLHSQLLELPHLQCCKSSKPFVPSPVPERSRPKEGGGESIMRYNHICLRSRVGWSGVMLWEGNLEIPLRAHWPPSVSPKGWFCMLPLDPQNSNGIRGIHSSHTPFPVKMQKKGKKWPRGGGFLGTQDLFFAHFTTFASAFFTVIFSNCLTIGYASFDAKNF